MTPPSSLTLIRAHQYLYYVLATPVITDYEYDMLCSAAGVEGGGGSDLASSYTAEERELAERLLKWGAMSVTHPTQYHAFYSAKAAAAYGSGIWLSIDGKTEVEVTCVGEHKQEIEEQYFWADRVYVGIVTQRLRQGKPDHSPAPIYCPYLPKP